MTWRCSLRIVTESRMEKIRVIDSHTAGEPTRLVISGAPELGGGSLAERFARLREKCDWLRTSLCLEPRASEAAVGALLCAPDDPANAAAVIFFNNSGYLGMCGHATIGLVATLEYLGKMQPGDCRIETPVGVVGARLHGNGRVTVTNVPSYRFRKDVAIEAEGYGTVQGDIAWGGNWFFLVGDPGIGLRKANLEKLTAFAKAVRNGLQKAGIRGDDGVEIDHVEVVGEDSEGADGRNFVLCPGSEYDRSPCGTGVSAKLACLYADGDLKEGEVWRQSGILGGVFEGKISVVNGELIPQITGEAFVTAETEIVFSPGDPYRHGIR
jgi:4-hydroxyproline epimerase